MKFSNNLKIVLITNFVGLTIFLTWAFYIYKNTVEDALLRGSEFMLLPLFLLSLNTFSALLSLAMKKYTYAKGFATVSFLIILLTGLFVGIVSFLT